LGTIEGEQAFLLGELELAQSAPVGLVEFVVGDVVDVDAGLLLDELGKLVATLLLRATEETGQQIEAVSGQGRAEGGCCLGGQGIGHGSVPPLSLPSGICTVRYRRKRTGLRLAPAADGVSPVINRWMQYSNGNSSRPRRGH